MKFIQLSIVLLDCHYTGDIFLAISTNLKLLVFSSDYAVESPSFGLSNEGPTKLHSVPEQLTVGFKSVKLDSMKCVTVVNGLSSDGFHYQIVLHHHVHP